MNTADLTPMIYSIADALEIDMRVDYSQSTRGKLSGKRNVVMEVFEGYSPTVVTEVLESQVYDVSVVATVRIWGNLCLMIINDKYTQMLTLFVYDKSKAPKGKPFEKFWSRKHTYKWLDNSIKAIYSRSVFDTKWTKLESGTQRLSSYNYNRKHNISASAAYDEMWHGGLPK